MKPARREFNIFNVSAIDLFASALGAFMIVSFVLLPYFPNTGDATPPAPDPPAADPEPPAGLPGTPDDVLQDRLAEVEAERAGLETRLAEAEAERDALRNRLAGAEAERAAARARERALQQALAEAESRLPKLPPIDLVIALDTTSSMTDEVASLREEIAGLAELLAKLTEDAAVGLIDFKDRCDPATALRIAALRPIDRRSARQLAAFARTMRPGSTACNTTADEDYAEALRAAVNTSWRADSDQRSIVMISDNPAHADRREQAIADARRFARRRGARHAVSAVFVDTSDIVPAYPDTAAFMQRVAEAGRGQFVRADEQASLSVTILQALFSD